ncbi:unnamed protein product [Gongylonema pulchrum]|uniref:DEP domain-containing protein n=1 Tax=Gongylonema pulchrum TaxID=637853 RepID=A0A183DQ12_9BILA|nr:unnamed protein product [Gongylonema pulchrum]
MYITCICIYIRIYIYIYIYVCWIGGCILDWGLYTGLELTDCFVQCTSAEANKPYILTLNDLSTTRNDGTPRRSRMRNITTETFATLNKPQPMFCEHKPKLSMYSNWQQSTVDSEEAKLNLLYMSTCSTKPRMGVKQLWRYTTALREMGVLKVTHSSFWDYSNKARDFCITF